jgi:hypothetical protein
MPVQGTIYNNSAGVFLDMSGLDSNTARVLVTLTTIGTFGGDGKGTVNFTHYMSASETAQFQVDLATPIDTDYIVTLEGRTAANAAISGNSFSTQHTYVSPPTIDDITVGTVSSGSQQINIPITDICDNVTHVQVFFTEMESPFRTCNIMIAANDCSNSTVVVDGSSAEVNGAVVAINTLTQFTFVNGRNLEYAIHAVNASGRSGDYVTAQISPSANANTPTSLSVVDGSDLAASPYNVVGTTDETLAIRFTPGEQIVDLADVAYILQVGSLYREFLDASFIDDNGDKFLVFDNSGAEMQEWTDQTSGQGGSTTLELLDGSSVAVSIVARNENTNGDGLSESRGPENGTPSGIPETPVFTVTTGNDTGSGTVKLTIVGDITSTALDNGSDITLYAVDVSGETPGVTGNFIDSSNVAVVTGLVNGTEYSITVTATNENGTNGSAVLTATPSTVPVALVFNDAESKPDMNAVSDLSSATINVAWGQISDTGGVDISNVTYSVQVSTDASYNTLVKDVSAIAYDTLSQEFDGLTNGTSYYVRIRASNVNGDGDYTELGNVLVPSREPDASQGLEITSTLLDSFITYSSRIESGNFQADVSTLVGNADLLNIAVNGGYEITHVKLEVGDDNSGWVTIDTSNIELNPTNNGTLTCNMYLGNAVYKVDSNPVTTTVNMTTVKATTNAATSTTVGSEELTFQFTQATDSQAVYTTPTAYTVALKESVPTQTANGEIVYGDYSEKQTQEVSVTSETTYEVSYTGLTNGYKYQLSVVTQSKQPLKDSQVNLRDISDSDEVLGAEAMPFGRPILTVTNGAAQQVGIEVQANGRALDDAYMFHPGNNGDNAIDYSTDLIDSVTTANAENNNTYFATAAPFNTYVDMNGATQPFKYTKTPVTVGANYSYLTMVSGQQGHFTIASSANAISDLLA